MGGGQSARNPRKLLLGVKPDDNDWGLDPLFDCDNVLQQVCGLLSGPDGEAEALSEALLSPGRWAVESTWHSLAGTDACGLLSFEALFFNSNSYDEESELACELLNSAWELQVVV
ncbi:hypothetical protein HYH03_014205 [Edaphochlamys debaryana]|uniref:Uncharacterized protein n=1 Tax=Edaphochlamys debaryana TaxID=47281 RepID=A0A835XNC3_9CHLO|nr:hypothetical protein HYH03_014205 [Edaphochlamys debaryana]|eukprot:KAG2487233.1 hypothetical protein HYH03_014205 [Edaphochlamys debaryana]